MGKIRENVEDLCRCIIKWNDYNMDGLDLLNDLVNQKLKVM